MGTQASCLYLEHSWLDIDDFESLQLAQSGRRLVRHIDMDVLRADACGGTRYEDTFDRR